MYPAAGCSYMTFMGSPPSSTTRSPSREKSRSASDATLRRSSSTSILSLAIAVTSLIVIVDEGDAVALVIQGLLLHHVLGLYCPPFGRIVVTGHAGCS
jgi:hypothetical protein